MPASPSKRLRPGMSSYKPSIAKTCGQRPACLVNASVTYCGNDTIFAFGGFDQYTDEVYNHVLKLDLRSLQWSLVDNYGDIPGVRMGHTACLWHDSKLLVYGGENEHRELLSDVIIYDLKTSHWTQPEIRGPIPKGRARHATAVYDDKLYVVGGVTGTDTYTCDEILYLDLKTWTWSRSWSFVARYDHSAWVWGGRIWVFGGLGPDMERTGDLWWLDLKSSPAFKSAPSTGSADLPQTERGGHHGRLNAHFPHREAATGSTGYAANSSSVQVRGSLVGPKSMAPGSMATVRFMSGPDIPAPAAGTHFHAYSSGALLDFTTPAGMLRPWECNLTALDLKSLQWQKLASGSEVFDPSYRWHYCAVNEDGTKAWLLGCAVEANEEGIGGIGEYLSDVLPLDLRRFGLLGNEAAARSGSDQVDMPASDTHATSNLTSLGVDLSAMFDQKKDSGWDFVVTASRDEADDGASAASSPTVERAPAMPFMDENAGTSPPIHVHRLILQARWPHFKRLYNSEMAEFQTKKLHVPEPYSVVRAFLYYLYTDSIGQHAEYCKDLDDVAGLLVMAQMYDMQRLRLLCLNRLSRELDVEHAAVIWERAGSAQDEWLQKRAANYCLTYWGRVVRTEGFRQLSRRSMMELCEAIDLEGRVVGGEELEMIGGLGGSKLSMGGVSHEGARRRTISQSGTTGDDENEGQEDEGMELS